VPSALHLALNGGEDYELLFTVPAGRRVPGKMAGIPIRAIGRIKPRTRGKSLVEMVTATGKRVPLHAGGWEHFRPKTGQH